MRRLLLATACFAACAFPGRTSGAEKPQLIIVRGPAVIAFFKPVMQAELEKDPDTNETLSDFQLYARQVRKPLKKAGIEFYELYGNSIELRAGREVTTFRPGKVGVGYYLVAAGRKPRIEYGVMTDDDLLQVAHKYFVHLRK